MCFGAPLRDRKTQARTSCFARASFIHTIEAVEHTRAMLGLLPEEGLEALIEEITIESIELPPGEKALLSVQLPAEFVIIFDPVTHGTQFIDVKGEPTRERQQLALVFNNVKAPTGTAVLPKRISEKCPSGGTGRRSSRRMP